MLPMAEAEAMAEPAMAPMSMAAITLIRASPPGRAPTRVLAKAMSRWAIPPLFINWPESTKNGMANRAKLSSPVAMRWETVVRAGMAGMLTNMVSTEAIEMLQATGVPMANRMTKLKTRTRMGIYSMGLFFFDQISDLIIDDQQAAQGQHRVYQGQGDPQGGRMLSQGMADVHQAGTPDHQGGEGKEDDQGIDRAKEQ